MPLIMGSICRGSKGNIKLQNDNRMLRWDEFIKTGTGIDYQEYPCEENQSSLILHMGGTTGSPKGVMLTNDNFNCMAEQFILQVQI
jgi:long-chain acyl-CoA synthetase